MNGAVSFTMCVFGRLAWKRLPLYIFAQLIASFLAAVTIYGVYYGEDTLLLSTQSWILSTNSDEQNNNSSVNLFTEAISDYSGGNLTVYGPKATAGIFATYPAPYLSLMGGFIDQVNIMD